MPAAARNRGTAGVSVDVGADCELWSAYPNAEETVQLAIAKAASFEQGDGEIAVLLTSDAAIRTMNATWRGIDKPTNVLSFPAVESEGAHLGDIAIACETVERESASENKTFLDHLAHLSIHGYLHLIGFDHETDREAERMEQLETRILASLGIADPYADRPAADRHPD